ncbi:hypothetical protein MUB18_20815 [Sphingobacterium sp. PCS056]|uniref:hypothetical protein n=1 Tax=Sphingobacterium sp. PCS056 TaxID=2931400 RepID=UPI00200D19DF|nr:hypothetical protein [Sphingobacterium sp. PCS056]UPZ36532.1 hypothetical protein MUB18_20815 [Sphingobacterium sp. PCS056]
MKKIKHKKLLKMARLEADKAINSAFDEVHRIAETKTGDITPFQVLKMEELTEDLAKLITAQVWQNL